MSRYISNTDGEQTEMLNVLGFSSINELFDDIPDKIKLNRALNLPDALSEIELEKHMKNLSGANKNLNNYSCFLGAGAYDHYIPSVVDHIISRQEFYTAYTPYQPEISQGTLQAIFEYQTMICELTGMDVANASMYDGATALAEASVMASRQTKRSVILAANTVHPEFREVLKTYSRFNGNTVEEIGYSNGRLDLAKLEERLTGDVAAVIIQSPNFFGIIDDMKGAAELAHKNKSLFIAVVDPLSLAILKAPAEMGADIVVGEGQELGNPLNFGGPYLGFMAVTKELMRKMPGRIVGETVDSAGRRGFVLTIQTREQHIRREKATSNICSNQALNALAATVYMSVLGKQGLAEAANLCIQKSHYAYQQLINTGKFTPVFNAPFFKEFIVRCNESAGAINKKLLEHKIIGGYEVEENYPEIKNGWLVAVTEKRTKSEIDDLVAKAVI